METKKDDNVFASPWNGSDMILVVEDQELHVHKWILITHSPVFKAMLKGHFQEANQDKVTLKEKNYESMVQFLKILYPSSMFGEARQPLNDKTRLSIMELAEEYQCVNLIKLCFDEAKISRENVLEILPYAVKYHEAALPEMFKITNWSSSASKLEEILPSLEGKSISSSNKMLLTKCRFLESRVAQTQDALISLMHDFLLQKKKTDDAWWYLNKLKKDHDKGSCSGSVDLVSARLFMFLDEETQETERDSRCSHCVGMREIKKLKGCANCKKKYKEKFIAPIPSCKNAQGFLNMLLINDEIDTHVKE